MWKGYDICKLHKTINEEIYLILFQKDGLRIHFQSFRYIDSNNNLAKPILQFKKCYFTFIGGNALHCAALEGNLKIAQLLINSEIPLLETNKEGKLNKIIIIIISLCKDLWILFFTFKWNIAIISIGENALHIAALDGNLKIVELLINSAIPLLETNSYGIV